MAMTFARASDTLAATRCKSAARSAGFQACCIADSQIGGWPELAGASQVRNLRHSRFGNLRYDFLGGRVTFARNVQKTRPLPVEAAVEHETA